MIKSDDASACPAELPEPARQDNRSNKPPALVTELPQATRINVPNNSADLQPTVNSITVSYASIAPGNGSDVIPVQFSSSLPLEADTARSTQSINPLTTPTTVHTISTPISVAISPTPVSNETTVEFSPTFRASSPITAGAPSNIVSGTPCPGPVIPPSSAPLVTTAPMSQVVPITKNVEGKMTAVPKQRAVPILPKHTPILPRAVPLAPRPAVVLNVGDVSNSAGVDGERQSSREDDDGSDRTKRTQRPRAFTEHEDNVLINFWASNYDLFCRSSKLSFARKAAEYMNTSASKSNEHRDRTTTHEKQVHNKICYLVRRYDSVKQKYLASNESNRDLNTVMDIADAEFPYFSKIHAFMSKGQPTYIRKRKTPRGSLDSLPDVVIPDSAGEAYTKISTAQVVTNDSIQSDDVDGPPAKTQRINSSMEITGNREAGEGNDIGRQTGKREKIDSDIENGCGRYSVKSVKVAHGGNDVGTTSGDDRRNGSNDIGTQSRNKSTAEIEQCFRMSGPSKTQNNGVSSGETGMLVGIANEPHTNMVSVEDSDDEMDEVDQGNLEGDELIRRIESGHGMDNIEVIGHVSGGDSTAEDMGNGENRRNKEMRFFSGLHREREYELREKELVLRCREAKRLEAELNLRKREFERRQTVAKIRDDMQMVEQLRESAKLFFELGMNGDGHKCMARMAVLLKL